jgi:hypothetical protein
MSISRRSFLGGLTLWASPILSLQASRQQEPSKTLGLEVFPKHFLLNPGEQIHYSVVDPSDETQLSVDYDLEIGDPTIVRLIEPSGVTIEAMRPGRTELVVRTPTSERRFSVEVAGPIQPPMSAIHHSALTELAAEELLFVGHANRDGFDHTAVAKPGIDRLVEEAKRNGVPVVYWVSREYPNWYAADRDPEYAIISEGQEHQIRVEAERVVFTGGDFMYCTLRNVQMTLHGMVKNGRTEIVKFVLPAQAIWMADIQGSEQRNYPAPMILLSTFFARHADDATAYQNVVVPFLDQVITEFPVLGYPSDAPEPPLSNLLEGWSVVVRFSDRFERVYRRGRSNKTFLVEFQGV